MATQNEIGSMRQVEENLKSINKERLLRPSLGEESLEQAGFGKTYDAVMSKAAFVLQYGADVDSAAFNNARNAFETLRQSFDQQSKSANAQYVANRANFTNQVNGQIEVLKQPWPSFVSAALEARGFLQDEGIRLEYQNTVKQMKGDAEEVLQHVREESKKTLEEAKQLADEIEKRARRTAAHISVQQAQEQFRDAQKGFDKQVTLWAVLVVSSLAIFFAAAAYFVRIHFTGPGNWYLVYYTAIRITILTAIGAIATFCLRVLRAQLHMSERNRHRQRVANSMAAFVEAAVTPEQRDLILGQMVNAVVDFGASGLLAKEEDTVYAPKMTIDTITRTIAQHPEK